jgi:phage recombination protein Bet
MSENEAMTTKVPNYIVEAAKEIGEEKMRLLRDTVARGLTMPEFGLFVEVCRRTGLDPFAKQVYAVKRYDKREGREVMTIQLGIDGFRSIAERTTRYAGQRGPFWCGDDGKWVDVWLSSSPPRAAKIEVLRKDFVEPLVGIALWTEYCQTTRDGSPMGLWGKLPSVMLAKCAESVALRRAFPQELSGLYTSDEMAQASSEDRAQRVTESAVVARVEKALPPRAEAPVEADPYMPHVEGDPEPPTGPRTATVVSSTPTAMPTLREAARDEPSMQTPAESTENLVEALREMRGANDIASMSAVVARWKPRLADDLPLRMFGRSRYNEQRKMKHEAGMNDVEKRALSLALSLLVDGRGDAA